MRVAWLAILVLMSQGLVPVPSTAQTLRVALNQDPGVLDPTRDGNFFSGHVFATMCDKLFDIDPQLNIVPQLATGYRYEDPTHLLVTLRPGVTFQDGEKFDAAAVQYGLNRHLKMKGSIRITQLAAIQSIEVVDPLTIRIVLKSPSAPFVGQLAGRAGIMVSPKAADSAGDQFALAPVCAGPYAFVSRVAQGSVVLRRFAGHWNAAAYHFDEIAFPTITDPNARFASLQTGHVDLLAFVPPSDIPAARKDERLKVMVGEAMGYTSITFNLNNGAGAQSPIGRSALLRQAFDAALDRKALVDVAFDGMFIPTVQPNFHGSPFYVPRLPAPGRDLARAKALLQQAGVALPVPVELTVVNNPWARQCAEVIQSMVNEAGFDLKNNLMAYAASLEDTRAGNFQGYQIDGGGSPDPDGNTWPYLHSRGGSNISRYSNPAMDSLLDAARLMTDIPERRETYGKVLDIERQDMPLVYLFMNATIMAMRRNLDGLKILPDAIVRLDGARMVN